MFTYTVFCLNSQKKNKLFLRQGLYKIYKYLISNSDGLFRTHYALFMPTKVFECRSEEINGLVKKQ